MASEFVAAFGPVWGSDQRGVFVGGGVAGGVVVAQVAAAGGVGPEPDLVFDVGVGPVGVGFESVVVAA